MYQVLVQYLSDRYASFYVDKEITDYQELLKKVRAVVPYLKQLQADQVRLAYKDLQLGSFINIDPAECLHMAEMFRNVVACGSDIYRRVELKVRETDSPFLLEKRGFHLGSQHEEGDRSEREVYLPPGGKSTRTTLEPKSLAFPSSSGSEFGKISDWKASKQNQLTHKLQCLNDSKLAIETHIRELELEVIEPPRVGTYNTICGNCHRRGHRAEGNRGNDKCKAPSCTSFYSCGQKKKHPEHFEELRKMKKQLKDIDKEIDGVGMEKKNFESFQSKSISAFSAAVTPRLVKAFGEKYSLKTANGKLDLQKDIATLRLACDNKIPETSPSQSDREMFTSLLEKQRKVINEIHVRRDLPSSANGNQSTEITLALSPLRTERRKRRSRSTTSDSSEDSSHERRHKRRKKRSRSRKKSAKRKKSSRKKRKHYSSSSSDSEISGNGLSSDKRTRVVNSCKDRMGSAQATAIATAVTQKCNLDELATIAVAINDDKK